MDSRPPAGGTTALPAPAEAGLPRISVQSLIGPDGIAGPERFQELLRAATRQCRRLVDCERVRIWVLDAGPNRSTSLHVVGDQFDTVYAEGAYLLRSGEGGSQALALAPAQGGFVELAFPEAGHYPFVTHAMVDAERGAHGLFDVRAG